MRSPNSPRLAVALCVAMGLSISASQATDAIEGVILLEPESGGVSFAYDGPTGPEFWGSLTDANGNVAFPTCGTGTQQSPVNISVGEISSDDDLTQISFNYQPTDLEVLNNGRTIEVPYHSGSSITVAGDTFELLQFHFHGPSEHTFQGGGQFPIEMHLVHRNAAGQLAVVGVMIRRGTENAGFPTGRFLRQILPRAEGVEVKFDTKSINAADLLPADPQAYRYLGSLTTPPCSENVRWFVLKQPIEFSDEQVNILREALGQLEFASAAGANNRPTQPLNGRTIVVDGDDDDDD